ncbi:nucleotidyltransferase family protein [uncultured Psychroserpens sp.]|uniref:nucleotidyltransferase family protein n=1 Tax=uncultured Psychroserpens sp. TaxID=255436 RepID=UPI00261A884A|nr:nucleotidyltransferase family protein [uncultured Psychroserpens sp.]
MTVAITILAAGSSSRMKKIKQLLPIQNSTLLGIAIENALQSDADQVYCVLGANADLITNSIQNSNIKIIYNPKYSEGLSSSIIAGIEYMSSKPFDATLIMLGDQPMVDSEYLNKLIINFKGNPSQVVASEYSDKIGVPAIFPKTFYNQLLQLNGDKGASLLLNSETINIKTVTGSSLVDIDTEEDYNSFINSL